MGPETVSGLDLGDIEVMSKLVRTLIEAMSGFDRANTRADTRASKRANTSRLMSLKAYTKTYKKTYTLTYTHK